MATKSIREGEIIIKKFKDIFRRFEDAFSVLGLVAGLLIIFYNVVMRYIFMKPQGWVDEVSAIVLAWAIIVGFGIDLGERSHICMDVLYEGIKSVKVRRIIDIAADLVGLLYGLFITYYGFQAVQLQIKSGRVYPFTEIPRWICFSIIVVVGLIMTVRQIDYLVDDFSGRSRAERIAKEKEGKEE